MDEELVRIYNNLRVIANAKGGTDLAEEYLRSEGYDGAAAFSQAVSVYDKGASAMGQPTIQEQATTRGGQRRFDPTHIKAPTTPADNTMPGELFNWGHPGQRPENVPASPREARRLFASGVLPGWSDEVLGTIRGVLGDETIPEAIDAERQLLYQGRGTDGSLKYEALGAGAGIAATMGAGALLQTAARAPTVAARAPGLARALEGAGGLMQGSNLEPTLGKAAVRSAKIGGISGLLAGSGEADGGDIWDRGWGGVKGGLLGGTIGSVTGGSGHKALQAFDETPAVAGVAAQLRQHFGAGVDPALITARHLADAGLPDTREARRALAHYAGTLREAGKTTADVAAQVPLFRNTPGVVADATGGAGRRAVAEVDDLASGTPLAEAIGETLADRSAGAPARRPSQIQSATRAQTVTPDTWAETYAKERSAVNNAMYSRARAANKGRRIETTDDLRRVLSSEEVQKAEKRIQNSWQGSGRYSDMYGQDETRQSLYVHRAAGKKAKPKAGQLLREGKAPPEVKSALDPTTASALSLELGEQAARAKRKGNLELHKRLQSFKKTLDGAIEQFNPKLIEANKVARQLRNQDRAYQRAFKKSDTDTPRVAEEWSKRYDQKPIRLPKDAAAAASDALGYKYGSVASPKTAAAKAAQAKLEQITTQADLGVRPATKVPLGTKHYLGEHAERELLRTQKAERAMQQTAAASPTAAGTLGVPQDSPSRNYFRLWSSAHGGGGRGGISANVGGLLEAVGDKMFAPSDEALARRWDILSTPLSTGRTQGLLNAVDISNRQLGKPIRRGLMNAAAWGTGTLHSHNGRTAIPDYLRNDEEY